MRKLAWLSSVAVAVAAPALAEPAAQAEPKPAQLDPIVVISQPAPRPRLRMAPYYPMMAKRRWEEGCVVLQFTVRPDGKTDDFTILESKPRGVFEKSVIGAVYRWEYERSPVARTVVELFEFRNQSLATQPVYTMRSAVKVPIGYDSGGARRYRLETQLQGYQPPRCKAG